MKIDSYWIHSSVSGFFHLATLLHVSNLPSFSRMSCMNNHGLFVHLLVRDLGFLVWWVWWTEQLWTVLYMFCVHTRACMLSHSVVSDSANPWTVAPQAPLSLGFPRQEYWSGLPFSSPGDCPEPGIKPASPALAGRFFTAEPPGKPGSHSPWGECLEVEFPSHRAVVGLTRRKCQTTVQSGCCVGYFLKFMKVTGDLASL